MERSNRNARVSLLMSPASMLAAIVAVSIGLALTSTAKTQPLRDAWREALRPGQQVLATSGEWLQAAREKVRGSGGAEVAGGAQKIAELNDRIQRLELELLMERSRIEAASSNPSRGVALASYAMTSESTPLLVSQAVPARVLGRQAKSFLVEREILDIGSSKAVRRGALVVDADASIDRTQVVDRTQVIDQGAAAGIAANRLVVSGRRIWGRIADVGPNTSTVQRANDVGYRDLVQLASIQDGRLQFSARGMLVGTGERLCKIELVETTQPVTVGDWVFTADDGVLETPLYYGRVMTLERKPGAAHWDIGVEPAVAMAMPPSRVSVLRLDLNPARGQ